MSSVLGACSSAGQQSPVFFGRVREKHVAEENPMVMKADQIARKHLLLRDERAPWTDFFVFCKMANNPLRGTQFFVKTGLRMCEGTGSPRVRDPQRQLLRRAQIARESLKLAAK